MSRGPFHSVAWDNEGLLQIPDDPFGTSLRIWTGADLELPSGGSHYGYVYEGSLLLDCASGRFELSPGMYFALPGPARLGGLGRAIVIERAVHRALFSLGGPIEEFGRLCYIDGCTDSLLLAPAVLGAPCLNLLHLPAGTVQTSHSHPSVRVGIVVSGSGSCVTPGGSTPLSPGQVFVIEAHGAHCFHTDEEALRVIAYHPDSDTGPQDHDHPMINRTYVGGRSASQLPGIRTTGGAGSRS